MSLTNVGRGMKVIKQSLCTCKVRKSKDNLLTDQVLPRITLQKKLLLSLTTNFIAYISYALSTRQYTSFAESRDDAITSVCELHCYQWAVFWFLYILQKMIMSFTPKWLYCTHIQPRLTSLTLLKYSRMIRSTDLVSFAPQPCHQLA